jgi:hypothetical protein
LIGRIGIRSRSPLTPPVQQRDQSDSQHSDTRWLWNCGTSDHPCPTRLVVVVQQGSQVDDVHGAVAVEVAILPDLAGLVVVVQKQGQVLNVDLAVAVRIAQQKLKNGYAGVPVDDGVLPASVKKRFACRRTGSRLGAGGGWRCGTVLIGDREAAEFFHGRYHGCPYIGWSSYYDRDALKWFCSVRSSSS